MRDKLKNFFARTGVKLRRALIRFPAALLMAAAAMIVLIVYNHTDYNYHDLRENLERSAMMLSLGIPLCLSIQLLRERIRLPVWPVIALYIGIAAVLSLYGLFGLEKIDMISGTRYTAISMASWALFLVLPYAMSKKGFTRYIVHLLIRFLITYLYAGVLYGGISAIIGAINLLFDLHLESKIYFDIFLTVAGIFAPVFFLAFIPEYNEDVPIERFPKVFRGLLLFIVMPLMTVYAGVLYAYFGKILITSVWPSGRVVHLTFWYSLLVLVVALLTHPLIAEGNTWAKTYSRFAPWVLLPLLGVMFTALGLRIHEYGITENRYLILAGGIWATGTLLSYGILRRRMVMLYIPVSAAVIALLCVLGPWNMYRTSIASQNLRFEAILAQEGILENGKVKKAANKRISQDSQREIDSILSYFSRYHGFKKVNALPDNFDSSKSIDIFGFNVKMYDYGVNMNERRWFSYNVRPDGVGMMVDGAEVYMAISTYQENEVVTAGDYTAKINRIEKLVTLSRKGGSSLVVDINKEAEGFQKRLMPGKVTTREELSITKESSDFRVTIVFTGINGWTEAGGKTGVDGANFEIWFFEK